MKEGDVLVSVGVSPDGRAVALSSPLAGRDKLRSIAVGRGGARFPVARTTTRVVARVVVHDPRPSLLTSVCNLKIAHPFVQPLPGDRALLVGGRCSWRARGPERNAQVVGSDGRTVAMATFGEGIAHVMLTPSGQIWVG